ncbi:MAG: UDP-N-acetylmuramate dehydrogenase [Chitinophagaceae bacterium]|nr:MAG: UDP-N-acetylmuramate dehydrogenase [Chitinophagaceae bacterium]
MQVHENYPLKSLNTFGLPALARYFAAVRSIGELQELLASYRSGPKLILGGGSNVLLTKDVDGLVVKNEIMGITKTGEDEDVVYLRSGAGENWHSLVLYAINNGLGGIENLSLIPGNVGASPMQNIGAYGVEIKDVFHELTAFHLEEKTNYTFRAKDCAFGYRESVFKNKYKGQFLITDVTFRLAKRPVFHTEYGAIRQELEKMGVSQPGLQTISQAVINIRSSKLPDPKQVGNAGSFFKNPSVPAETFELLKSSFPGIVGYTNADGSVKLAAGWLIEHSGPPEGGSWKGYRDGDAGVHAQQALVLVNYGNASGAAIYELSGRVMQSVEEKFGVSLEREVNIL